MASACTELGVANPRTAGPRWTDAGSPREAKVRTAAGGGVKAAAEGGEGGGPSRASSSQESGVERPDEIVEVFKVVIVVKVFIVLWGSLSSFLLFFASCGENSQGPGFFFI